MRGIVSLAAALALPEEFPYRNLILLAAFSVVVGTLVIQGLTLKPLLRWLNLQDDDPVSHEVAAARERALSAALASLDGNPSSRWPNLRARNSNCDWPTRTARMRAQVPSKANCSGRRWVPPGKLLSPCERTMRSATTRSTRSKSGSTGSTWRRGPAGSNSLIAARLSAAT
jgi:NhaP-type Na+/H+ or K+/H+ antiporter